MTVKNPGRAQTIVDFESELSEGLPNVFPGYPWPFAFAVLKAATSRMERKKERTENAVRRGLRFRVLVKITTLAINQPNKGVSRGVELYTLVLTQYTVS